jgi:ribosomal protein S12 methylthiotransferase
MAIQRRISRSSNRHLIGQEIPVLLEGPSAETDLLWQARMPSQAPEIDGVCYINDDNGTGMEPGQMRLMRITEAHDYDVVGELIDPAPTANPALTGPALFPILRSSSPEATRQRA